MMPRLEQRIYWRKTLRLTVLLLAVWFIVTFVVSFFARELNEIIFFGFPLGFYMGGQGALVVYVLIVGYYAWKMNALDERYAEHEPSEGEE